MKYSEQGFIALISAIVIAILLLTITFTLSFTGFFGRFNILDSEFKTASAGLAQSCVSRALIQIANDASITYPDTWEIDEVAEKICTIISVAPSGSNRIIKATSNYKDSNTNYIVTVTPTPTNVLIGSWDECENFSGNTTTC